MELWVNEFWILITAVLFTGLGYYFGTQKNISNVAEVVIDSLIEQGYLKTQGLGRNMQVIPWKEWCDDQTTGEDS